MSMTIGRCSINEDPYAGTMHIQGNLLSFSSDINAASVNEGKARIAQLAGLVANADEPVVPFTWTEDSTFDGFYRVLSVDMAWNANTLTTGTCEFTIAMERLGGYSKPQFETVAQSVVRTNSHAVSAPVGIVAAYFTPTAYPYDIDAADLASTSSATRTTEDGTVTLLLKAAPLEPAVTWRTWVQPVDYYKGQCRLEVQYGSTWYPIHGQQIPAAAAGAWRISNGFARAYPTAVNTTKALTVEVYDSAAWHGTEFCRYTYGSTGPTWTAKHTTGNASGYSVPKVLINRPELVAVQVIVDGDPMTFLLRAGDSWVEASYGKATGALTTADEGWGVTSTIAATSFTGGIGATSNDANGLKYAIAGAKTGTKDTTNGRVSWGTTLERSQFALSANDGQSTATFLDRFIAARSERRLVVAQ